MSDEVKATNFACCDDRCDDWLEWLIILGIIFFLLGGNNFFGRGRCCR
ncbi:MAG: hypothetical protein QM227_08295 [Bacillota bacterium]|jgi:hypothetical protein|nr:hypothetical protein [Bacillota bacterium]NLL60833.1 hypothetical protein [Tissierellia bacterium]